MQDGNVAGRQDISENSETSTFEGNDIHPRRICTTKSLKSWPLDGIMKEVFPSNFQVLTCGFKAVDDCYSPNPKNGPCVRGSLALTGAPQKADKVTVNPSIWHLRLIWGPEGDRLADGALARAARELHHTRSCTTFGTSIIMVRCISGSRYRYVDGRPRLIGKAAVAQMVDPCNKDKRSIGAHDRPLLSASGCRRSRRSHNLARLGQL